MSVALELAPRDFAVLPLANFCLIVIKKCEVLEELKIEIFNAVGDYNPIGSPVLVVDGLGSPKTHPL